METFFHEFGFRISILFKIDGRQKIDPVWISGTLNFALDLMSLFVTGKGPFLSQERLQLGKDSSILGKDPFPGKILSQNWWILSQFATGKGPFLSQLQTGKAWKGERKGKDLEQPIFLTPKTYFTSFQSLKCPNFKNITFKILEVSPCDSSARQHKRFSPNEGGSGRIGYAA